MPSVRKLQAASAQGHSDYAAHWAGQGAPLADLATVNLAIDVQEDTEIYTPLTSRIAHLVVIEVLAMGVAMARGPDLLNHLKSVKRSLRLSPKTVRPAEDD